MAVVDQQVSFTKDMLVICTLLFFLCVNVLCCSPGVSPQAEEDSVVYSAPDFTLRESRKRPEDYEECWYTEVRKPGLNQLSGSASLPVQ